MQRSAMVVESRTGTSIAGGPNRKKNRTAANPPTVLLELSTPDTMSTSTSHLDEALQESTALVRAGGRDGIEPVDQEL